MKKIIILLTLFTISQSVSSANSYLVNKSSSKNITEHGVCKKVTVTDNNTYFVPTKYKVEWDSFINNIEKNTSGVKLGECSYGKWYGLNSTQLKAVNNATMWHHCRGSIHFASGDPTCRSYRYIPYSSVLKDLSRSELSCSSACQSYGKVSVGDSKGNRCANFTTKEITSFTDGTNTTNVTGNNSHFDVKAVCSDVYVLDMLTESEFIKYLTSHCFCK